MTIFRCMVLFILLIIPTAATGESTAGPTVVSDQYTHPVALNWYREECNELVESFTDLNNDVVDYIERQANWLENRVVENTEADAENCKVSCQDPTGQLKERAKRYKRRAHGLRGRAEEFGEIFQSWIDFVGKCIKSIETGGPQAG